MVLAELEVFASRPVAPTRRIALGRCDLPVAPAPGPGGILLAGVAATFSPRIDAEQTEDLLDLMFCLEAGVRVTQPRLRHRLQSDRVGLRPSRHRVCTLGGETVIQINRSERLAAPVQNLLGAVYAAGRLGTVDRSTAFAALRWGMLWRGRVGPGFVSSVAGAGWWKVASRTAGGERSRAWACEMLGLEGAEAEDRAVVLRAFRTGLLRVHPDRGGMAAEAPDRIADLAEARRILLDR